MTEEIQNSMDDYISARPAFSLQAANETYVVSPRLIASGFVESELSAIREAIFPYGGAFYLSDIKFNGIASGGQRLDIYTPLGAGRSDSHILSLSKVAVSETLSNYAVQHVQTNAVLPANKFDQVLKIAGVILENGNKNRTSHPGNSLNG